MRGGEALGSPPGKPREEEARARLRARGLTLTRVRRAVLAALGEGGHPTAAEAHLAIKEEHPRISLATVYAALSALERVGLIGVRHFPGEATRYDGNTSEHIDVLCGCGAITEVGAGALVREVEERVKEGSSYEAVGISVVARGICPACAGEPGGSSEAVEKEGAA